jgi:hypothetical protein
VLTGDMLTGHSLNAGQMSSDFSYLTTLPIPPGSLIAIKLIERMMTDYIGLLLLLTGIFGIVFRNGFNIEGLFLGLIIYLQISFSTGLVINLITISMQRFFRKATINNLFSILGYLSVFLTFLPYLLLSSFPGESLNWLVEWSDSFSNPIFKIVLPFRWLAETLLQTNEGNEFVYWSLFWLAASLLGCLFFYIMISLNWLTVTHSASRSNTRKRRIFSGFFQKELLLLKSDFNMLVNAIMMPISIIVLEIYFLKNVINLSTSSQLLNLLYAAIVYFCMFGPINSVGAEGKSIAIIESLPMSASDFVYRKFFFWLVIAETIFIPTSLVTMYYMGYLPGAIFRFTFLISAFTATCVWISIHISSIFPNFESKILQQKSTLTGKASGLLLMLLAAPIKSFNLLSLINLIILIIALLLVRQITLATLKNRLDPDFNCLSPDKIHPFVLLLLVFTGSEISIKQFFLAIIPGYDTGLWSWLIASLLFYSAVFLYAGKNLYSNKFSFRKNLLFKPATIHIFLVIIASVILAWSVNYSIVSSPENYLSVSSNIKTMFEGEALSALTSDSKDQNLLFHIFYFAIEDIQFIFSLILISLCSAVMAFCFFGCLSVCNGLLARILSLVSFGVIALPGFTLHFVILWFLAFFTFSKSKSVILLWILTIPSIIIGFSTLLFL